MKKFILIPFLIIWCSVLTAQDYYELSPTLKPANQDPAQEAIWDVEFNYDATAITGAAGNAGAVYIPTINKFWTSRWASAVAHQWNANGTLDLQFTLSFTGTRGMCFDGQYIYHSINTTTVQKVDPVTRAVVGTVSVVGAPNGFRFITYNPDGNAGAGSIIGGNWTSPNFNFYEFSLTGTLLRTITNTQSGIYGLAYDNWSTGGPYLWVWTQGAGYNNPQIIRQMDYTTGIYTGVQHDVKTDVGVGQDSCLAGGLFITDDLISGKVILGGMLQGTPNRLFGYELTTTGTTGPGPATDPDPVIGATGVSAPNTTLSWTNPAGATSNAVYFGTNPSSLNLIHSGSLASSVNVTSLGYYTQYYWRVDETGGTGTTVGAVWSFTTQFDPSLGSWTSGVVFPTTTYMGSGVAANGFLFSMGGNTTSTLGTECYKYNVASDTWTPIASLPVKRIVFATANVGNFIYAIGGSDGTSYSTTTYRYDINLDSWTTVAPLPDSIGWGKAVGYNNKIYLAGGVDRAVGGAVLSTVYVYDITSNTWAAATSMPGPKFGGAFSVTGNKLVYVAGANATVISSDVYVGTIDGTDPTLIVWTTMDSPYPGTEGTVYTIDMENFMNSEISSKEINPIEAAAYPAGTMYRFDAAPWGTDGIIVANGSPSAAWVPANPNPCYVYKPATDSWVQQPNVPIPVLGASLGTVSNGPTWKLIVASGYTGSAASNATQIYTDDLGGASTFQLSVNIANGWNMVSVPGMHPTDQNVNTWWAFRDMGANVFRYAGGYQSVTAAAPGTGYWMKHAGVRTYNTGDEWPAGGINVVPHTPLTAASGWNLFGGYELIVTAANVTTNPPGLQSGPIYKYAGGYSVATTLDPGYGYWIKLTGAGQIIIPETLAKGEEPVEYFPENWGKIVLTDATGINYTLYAVKGEVNLDNYELPPAPMAGMFDIRYSSGRIAEDINSSLKTIDMSGVTYPLTVRVEGMDMRLMDETGKTVNVNLKSGEDVVISDATIQKLMVSGELVPAAYALEQNYPNPFNPSTVIEFSLPENVGNVKLSIYNMLGERVAELVNTALVAGKYSYQWNASNVATGMYIYELRTDNFVSVKKMLLLK